MSAEESSSYAPKSPDLSSLFSAGPTDQPPAPPPLSLDHHYTFHSHHHQHHHHHHHQPQNTSSPYQPQPPNVEYGGYSGYVPPTSPYTSNPTSIPNNTYLPQQLPPQPPPPSFHPSGQFVPQAAYGQPPPHFHSATPHGQPQPVPVYPGQGAGPPIDYKGKGRAEPPYIPDQSYLPPTPTPTTATNPEESLQLDTTKMPPRRAAAAAAAGPSSAMVAEEPPLIEPSPVKTKFPTARIKRIMQADEEVGKVAQQTPIAVGKALEMFMVQLVTRSAEVAKEKGSKRVTAPMLKQVVERDDQWDFLRDIVSKVEPEKEGSRSKQAKGESESDEEVYEPKKRGRGGRKKKVAA